MVLSYIIGAVLRLVNLLFTMFPAIADITASLGSALSTIFSFAVQWEWILPIQEALRLVVFVIQFELAIMLLVFGKWVVELIRGK